MINIKSINMDITSSINKYISKRLSVINKFTEGLDVSGDIEVSKTTNHHKQGEFFRAEIGILVDGQKYYSASEEENLYNAIDKVKDEIIGQIKRDRNKKRTLFKRGAASIKKMMKGISNRNPFTSKY